MVSSKDLGFFSVNLSSPARIIGVYQNKVAWLPRVDLDGDPNRSLSFNTDGS
jgi:hypothetical protein